MQWALVERTFSECECTPSHFLWLTQIWFISSPRSESGSVKLLHRFTSFIFDDLFNFPRSRYHPLSAQTGDSVTVITVTPQALRHRHTFSTSISSLTLLARYVQCLTTKEEKLNKLQHSFLHLFKNRSLKTLYVSLTNHARMVDDDLGSLATSPYCRCNAAKDLTNRHT